MSASILSLATAVPPHTFYQDDVANKMIEYFPMTEEKKEVVKKIYQSSAIHKRHCILPDFNLPRSEWQFWGSDYPEKIPGMSERNDVYKKEAPRLAHEVAQKALEEWGGDPSSITHVISVSCTGVMAPGIEFELMRSLHLKPSVNRLGINFMGCFGAFKALSVARSFAAENKSHRILLVCTELCSLHLQASLDYDTVIGNALFADGAAAAVVGVNPQSNEKVLWELRRSHSFGLENSLDKMGWEASSHGFKMRLSPTVPVLIGRHIQPFVETLLSSHVQPKECNWAIHPGGKSILQAVEKVMKLDPSQTQASWNTLSNYGNMSSPTFLFVLDEILRQREAKEWTLGIGFGPGLSIEGILLRRSEK